MPVRFQNGNWEVVTELEINEKTQNVLGRLSHELVQVRVSCVSCMPILPPTGTLWYSFEHWDLYVLDVQTAHVHLCMVKIEHGKVVFVYSNEQTTVPLPKKEMIE